MEPLPIDSSAIRSVAYDAAARRLAVTFQSGAVYEYDDVPEETYEAMMRAESKGRFFQDEIRRRFAYSRPGDRHASGASGGDAESDHWMVREALEDGDLDDTAADEPPVTRHSWRVDVLDGDAAAVEVDGRAVTPIPRWILPLDAQVNDVLDVTHARGATRSELRIARRR